MNDADADAAALNDDDEEEVEAIPEWLVTVLVVAVVAAVAVTGDADVTITFCSELTGLPDVAVVVVDVVEVVVEDICDFRPVPETNERAAEVDGLVSTVFETVVKTEILVVNEWLTVLAAGTSVNCSKTGSNVLRVCLGRLAAVDNSVKLSAWPDCNDGVTFGRWPLDIHVISSEHVWSTTCKLDWFERW